MKSDLYNAVDLVRSLRDYVSGFCCHYDTFEEATKNMSPTVCQFYKTDTQRRRRWKQLSGSTEPECELSGWATFCIGVHTYNWQTVDGAGEKTHLIPRCSEVVQFFFFFLTTPPLPVLKRFALRHCGCRRSSAWTWSKVLLKKTFSLGSSYANKKQIHLPFKCDMYCWR